MLYQNIFIHKLKKEKKPINLPKLNTVIVCKKNILKFKTDADRILDHIS